MTQGRSDGAASATSAREQLATEESSSLYGVVLVSPLPKPTETVAEEHKVGATSTVSTAQQSEAHDKRDDNFSPRLPPRSSASRTVPKQKTEEARQSPDRLRDDGRDRRRSRDDERGGRDEREGDRGRRRTSDPDRHSSREDARDRRGRNDETHRRDRDRSGSRTHGRSSSDDRGHRRSSSDNDRRRRGSDSSRGARSGHDDGSDEDGRRRDRHRSERRRSRDLDANVGDDASRRRRSYDHGRASQRGSQRGRRDTSRDSDDSAGYSDASPERRRSRSGGEHRRVSRDDTRSSGSDTGSPVVPSPGRRDRRDRAAAGRKTGDRRRHRYADDHDDDHSEGDDHGAGGGSGRRHRRMDEGRGPRTKYDLTEELSDEGDTHDSIDGSPSRRARSKDTGRRSRREASHEDIEERDSEAEYDVDRSASRESPRSRTHTAKGAQQVHYRPLRMRQESTDSRSMGSTEGSASRRGSNSSRASGGEPQMVPTADRASRSDRSDIAEYDVVEPDAPTIQRRHMHQRVTPRTAVKESEQYSVSSSQPGLAKAPSATDVEDPGAPSLRATNLERRMSRTIAEDGARDVLVERNAAGRLGLTVGLKNGRFAIQDVEPTSPAARVAGVCVGDTLVSVDGVPVDGQPYSFVIGLLRDSPGAVRMCLLREPTAEPPAQQQARVMRQASSGELSTRAGTSARPVAASKRAQSAAMMTVPPAVPSDAVDSEPVKSVSSLRAAFTASTGTVAPAKGADPATSVPQRMATVARPRSATVSTTETNVRATRPAGGDASATSHGGDRMRASVGSADAAVRECVLERDSGGKLGITIVCRDNRQFCTAVDEQSPAFRKAHLRAGDELLQINGASLSGLSHEAVIGMLRAARGPIRLQVRPAAAEAAAAATTTTTTASSGSARATPAPTDRSPAGVRPGSTEPQLSAIKAVPGGRAADGPGATPTRVVSDTKSAPPSEEVPSNVVKAMKARLFSDSPPPTGQPAPAAPAEPKGIVRTGSSTESARSGAALQVKRPRPASIAVTTPRREYRALQIKRDAAGKYGFALLERNQRHVVGDVDANSPAYKVGGIRPGDIVCDVNGTSVDGMGHEQVVALLKAARTGITLGVERSI